MRKNKSAQELANAFPTWSRIRTNEQSNGFQFFNVLAKPLDKMGNYLERMRHNQYLSTVNLDEVDWLTKVELPLNYEFIYDTIDPFLPREIAPTARGYNGTTWLDVELADDNSLESMWYTAVPTRADLEETVTGKSEVLISSGAMGDFPFSGMLTHPLGGGKLWIEAHGGIEYIYTDDDGKLARGRVHITGTTRKQTKETEVVVFPWDMQQPTLKEWESITDVEVYDMEDDVDISLRTANFNTWPTRSFYNLRWSDTGTKIDEFWDIGTFDYGTTIDRMGYISDDWQTLALGFSEKVEKDRWEILDSNLSKIDAVDLTVQPFSDMAWVVDNTGKLYCFDLEDTIASGTNFLAARTDGAEVRLECSSNFILLGDDIGVTPIHVRPTREIDKYRLWYETPTGNKYGLKAGASVSMSSNFWAYPSGIKREIEAEILLTAAERGEYIFNLEVYYSDETIEKDVLIIPVKFKQPKATIDISSDLSGAVEGIDFDSDQRLWVKTDTGFYRFSLHADLMIVDYRDKIIYFREPYESVEIT